MNKPEGYRLLLLFRSVMPVLSGRTIRKRVSRLSVISLSESVSDHSPLHWCNIWQGDLASVVLNPRGSTALSRRWLGKQKSSTCCLFHCWSTSPVDNTYHTSLLQQSRRIKRRNHYSLRLFVGSPRCWVFNDGPPFCLSPPTSMQEDRKHIIG